MPHSHAFNMNYCVLQRWCRDFATSCMLSICPPFKLTMTSSTIEVYKAAMSLCLSVCTPPPFFRHDRRTATNFGTHIRIDTIDTGGFQKQKRLPRHVAKQTANMTRYWLIHITHALTSLGYTEKKAVRIIMQSHYLAHTESLFSKLNC